MLPTAVVAKALGLGAVRAVEVRLAGMQQVAAALVQVAGNAKLVPLSELQAPLVEPAKLNSKKVADLMTQAGLL